MKILFFKIKYFFGTIYRGMIGRYHNSFDKTPAINSNVESFVIGKSGEGREIKVYKIISGNSTCLAERESRRAGSFVADAPQDDIRSKKILFVAGIHGNEIGTVKLAHYIINFFNDFNDFNGVLYVILCLNPDGYERALKNPDYAHRGRIGRFNANDVDLNRNFPTKNFQPNSEWGFGRDYSDEKIKIFCGEFGGSEKETQALINFIKSENIENLIMLHNAGKDVVYNQSDETAKNWAEIYHKITKFKIRTNLNYSGGVAEWAKENNIHYLTVEGGSRWGSDWQRQRQAIEKIIINNS